MLCRVKARHACCTTTAPSPAACRRAIAEEGVGGEGGAPIGAGERRRGGQRERGSGAGAKYPNNPSLSDFGLRAATVDVKGPCRESTISGLKFTNSFAIKGFILERSNQKPLALSLTLVALWLSFPCPGCQEVRDAGDFRRGDFLRYFIFVILRTLIHSIME